MSTVQVADLTFVAADRSLVAAEVARAAPWRRWFPDLRLTVTEQRHDSGVRWAVEGALAGTSEVWIEPHLDGAMVHFFLHAEPPAPLSGGQVAAEVAARRVRAREVLFEVKFAAESGRVVGGPPVGSAGRA